jgi:hypothetical protein
MKSRHGTFLLGKKRLIGRQLTAIRRYGDSLVLEGLPAVDGWEGVQMPTMQACIFAP